MRQTGYRPQFYPFLRCLDKPERVDPQPGVVQLAGDDQQWRDPRGRRLRR
jgi:hypothetical protein